MKLPITRVDIKRIQEIRGAAVKATAAVTFGELITIHGFKILNRGYVPVVKPPSEWVSASHVYRSTVDFLEPDAWPAVQKAVLEAYRAGEKDVVSSG